MQTTKPVKKPRKQRKHLYNAPAHLRHKFMAAPLSQELISSKGAKALPVRKGDTVRIMRGDHTGFEGKVSRIDLKKYRIFIEGLTREKVDGTNIFVSVHPSKVMIKSLKLDDKWRQGIVERKKELELPKKEKEAVKIPKKVAEAKKEKPVKKPKAAARAEEKLPEKKLKVKPKAAQKKPVAKKKKEEAPAAEEKVSIKKKKKVPPVAEEKPAEKEKKTKAVKKAPAKRKTTASKKKGGT
jgi:large subunit ribosomal protein L24